MPSHDDYGKVYRCTNIKVENINHSQNICCYSQQVCDATTIILN